VPCAFAGVELFGFFGGGAVCKNMPSGVLSSACVSCKHRQCNVVTCSDNLNVLSLSHVLCIDTPALQKGFHTSRSASGSMRLGSDDSHCFDRLSSKVTATKIKLMIPTGMSCKANVNVGCMQLRR